MPIRIMLDFVGGNSKYRPFVPGYPIMVVSLRDYENPDIFTTSLRDVFHVAKCQGDRDRLKDYFEENGENRSELDEETYDMLSVFVNEKRIVEMKGKYQKKGVYDMCQAMREWREELLAQGEERGKVTEQERIAKLVGILLAKGGTDELAEMSKGSEHLDALYKKYRV